jgi:hypothetical protein
MVYTISRRIVGTTHSFAFFTAKQQAEQALSDSGDY